MLRALSLGLGAALLLVLVADIAEAGCCRRRGGGCGYSNGCYDNGCGYGYGYGNGCSSGGCYGYSNGYGNGCYGNGCYDNGCYDNGCYGGGCEGGQYVPRQQGPMAPPAAPGGDMQRPSAAPPAPPTEARAPRMMTYPVRYNYGFRRFGWRFR